MGNITLKHTHTHCFPDNIFL